MSFGLWLYTDIRRSGSTFGLPTRFGAQRAPHKVVLLRAHLIIDSASQKPRNGLSAVLDPNLEMPCRTSCSVLDFQLVQKPERSLNQTQPSAIHPPYCHGRGGRPAADPEQDCGQLHLLLANTATGLHGLPGQPSTAAGRFRPGPVALSV